jgi:hypothetical protein
MKQSIQTIIKIVLLALIGFTLILFFLPVSTEIPQDILNPPVKKDKNKNEDTETTEITLRHPNYIAVLFGWVIPTPTPTPRVTPRPTPTPVPTPVTPGWLSFIGYSREDNVDYYSFKDDRYKTIFKVAKGIPDKGWYFIRKTSEGYELKKDGQEYFVPSKR